MKHTFSIKQLFLFASLICNLAFVKAQVPGLNIGTYTVTDCRAKFYDDGGFNQPYTSILNTNTTYTFCIFVGSQITMTFNPNPTQTQIQAGDFITFYNGPNTLSPIIAGPFTATTAIPPIVATSGSLTVVWSENGNTVGHGWDAGWYSLSTPPATPSASIFSTPACNSNQIILNTSHGVLCDSLKPQYFILNGPMTPGIATVIPSPCNNGTTNVIQINLQNPINKNCTYTLNTTLFRPDNCDSAYKFQNIVNTFSISDCPIQASLNIMPTNTVCAYSCNTTLTAVSPATTCLNFNYSWNEGLPPTAGPHIVCPTVTTVYSCTMTEQTTLAQTILTRTVYVIDPQIAPILTPSVCQSQPSFTLSGSPAGGYWIGPGISNSLTGMFCPGCTGAGVKTLTYQIGTCTATTQITVIQISAGNPDAACLGAPPFTVTGGTPLGGTWYGDPDITNAGVFTPSVLGTHTVLYTEGSCTSTPKQIIVTNAITVPVTIIDICQSQWYTQFYNGYGITPYGGRYSMVGPGITNNVLGTFSPSLTTPGIHVITYSLASGCSETFTVNVLEINVAPATATTCPTKAPFIPTFTVAPAGGTWSCITAGSITNSVTGMYNPSASSVNSHTDLLVYTASNGCKDTLSMRAIKTTIVKDTLFFCSNSNTVQLTSNTVNINYFPVGGIYSGPGVSLVGVNYVFNPAVSGPGIHTVYYDMNTCTDSIKMVVYPSSPSIPNRTVCSTHTPFNISATVPIGATWSGNGITNPSTGLFNPSSVLAGNTYTLSYIAKAPLTCTGQAQISVYAFAAANISNLSSSYCYRNQNYTISIVPANGTLTAPPTLSNNIFNPSINGPGNFSVVYKIGEGQCHTKDSVFVTVYPQLVTTYTLSEDSICIGEAANINVNASGGLPSVTNYTYNWSHNLLSFNSHNVSPLTTTIYTVISTDGCSDPVTNTFQIIVSPSYSLSCNTTSIQCYGLNGQATVNVDPPGNYSYNWNTTPTQTSTVLNGIAGKSYQLKIKNLTTGCLRDTFIKVPGYNAIEAMFIPNPNMSCIPFTENTVTFIDLSNGALNGSWNYDGITTTYTIGQSVQHEFKEPGTYNVSLTVYNEGNCSDNYTQPICILESTDIFIPDIFSPNSDGNNDKFYVRSNGIKELTFTIFDRWGNKVFHTTDQNIGWDGTFNGKTAEPGIYAYFLDVILVDDKKTSKKGEITLVR